MAGTSSKRVFARCFAILRLHRRSQIDDTLAGRFTELYDRWPVPLLILCADFGFVR
jgi:hypothetical protein